MPKTTIAVNNFTSGEISPELYGRVDTDQYKSGAAQIQNMVVKYYGGLEATPGTRFVYEVKDSEAETIVQDFQFSDEQAYILEFGTEYMRVFKDQGIVLSGAVPYELVTPFTSGTVDTLQFAQTADLMYIANSSTPQVLSRTGHASWSITDFAFKRGPLIPENATSTTITPSAATGTGITLTASSSIFVAGHVGSIWKINEGYVEIKTYSSGTSVTADVLYGVSLGGTSAYTSWSEGAWSDYRGWPKCVYLFEGRLWWASTDYEPNTIWASKPFTYDDYEEGADDDDGLRFEINQDKISRIFWLSATDLFLVYGSQGGIGRIWSGSSSEPITPSSGIHRTMSTYGSEDVPALKVGDLINYVQKHGKSTREIIYSLDADAYRAQETSLLSRHLLDDTVVDMAYQQTPDNILWCVTGSGNIATLTRNVEQKIMAWSEQITEGSYESIACIPSNGYDEVWVVVQRIINGVSKRYIEYFVNPSFDDIRSYAGSHSSLEYTGAATSTITGLDHLIGEEVAIIADGVWQPNETVNGSGEITLAVEATQVQVGLPRTWKVELLPLEAGSAIGSARSKLKRVVKVGLQLYKTVSGINITGANSDVTDTIVLTTPSNYDTPPELFTGLKEDVTVPEGWGANAAFSIWQDKAYPGTILGIYPLMETMDG